MVRRIGIFGGGSAMKSSRFYVGAVLALLILFQHQSPAQVSNGDVLLDTELIALSIHEPVEGLYYISGNEIKIFRSGMIGMGLPMPYSGPNPLRLYREPPPLPDEETGSTELPTLSPIVEVILPENHDRVFLLLEQKPGEHMSIRAIPVSFDRMSAGSYLVFNFASASVGMLLEENLLSLKPRTMGLLTRDNWREGRQDLLSVIALRDEDRMRAVYSRVWGHDPERRYFVFIFDGSHPSSPLRIRKVYDRLPSP